MPTIYQEHGHANRSDYLRALAEEHGAQLSTVVTLAAILGPSEDFDGLVTALEDAADELNDE